MTQLLLSAALGRTLLIQDSGILMFEAASDTQFEPRAYEIEHFLANAVVAADPDDREAIASFELAARKARGVTCALSILDKDLRSATRVTYLEALETLLDRPSIGDGIVRALLSHPLETRLLDCNGAVQLAKVSGNVHAYDLLCEFEDKRSIAMRAHTTLEKAIARAFAEPLPRLILDALREAELVGWFAAGRFGPIARDASLARLLGTIAAALPDEIAIDAFLEVVTTSLLSARTAPTYHTPHHLLAIGSIGDSDDNVLAPPQLAESLGQLAQQLFEAGSLNDELERWAYLLDIALLGQPDNRSTWSSKIEVLHANGDFAAAVQVENFVREQFPETVLAAAIEPRGFAGIKLPKLLQQRLSNSFFNAPQKPVQALAEPSPRELLARFDDYQRLASRVGEASALIALTTPLLKHRIKQQQPLTTVALKHGVITKGGIVYAADLITPEMLLQGLATFVAAREAAGSTRAFRGLLDLIDNGAHLSELERNTYSYQLEMSQFFRNHQPQIAALYNRAPELGILLLGKLVVQGSGGGGLFAQHGAVRTYS